MEEPETSEEGKEDEQVLKDLMKKITETNKMIDDAYDEKIRRLEIKKKMIPDEHEQELHEAKTATLREALKELKIRISEARREGKDMFMPEMMLRNIDAKIKMAEVTREQGDFAEVEKLLKRVQSELEEALKAEELNVKKEIEARLKSHRARQTGKVEDED